MDDQVDYLTLILPRFFSI